MESGQEHRPYRRFGLGDGLILMAALALTLFVLRATGWFARLPARRLLVGDVSGAAADCDRGVFPVHDQGPGGVHARRRDHARRSSSSYYPRCFSG